MTPEYPFILYVGAGERGSALAAAAEERGYIFSSAETIESALGQYISFTPDTTIIDAVSAPAAAAEVLYHLRSIEARSIIIMSANNNWATLSGEGVEVVSPDLCIESLLDHAGALARDARTFRRHVELELIAELA